MSQSLRPYLLAALLDRDPDTPAIVVAGDDRGGARPRGRPEDLARTAHRPLLPEPRRHLRVAPGAAAAPRRACGSPRSTRCSSATDGRAAAPVVVVSAVALSEKVPDPSLRPHGFALRTGDLIDLDETAHGPRRRRLRARRPGRGPRPVRDPRRPARRVPGDRGPRRAGRPVRRRDRVAAVVLDLHPALARRRRAGRGRAGGRAGRGAPRAGRDRRARGRGGPARHRRAAAGRELPSVPGARAGRRVGPDRRATRTSRPALADHWQDVTAAFHDEDAHHLYVDPETIVADARRSARGSACRASTRTSRSRSAPSPPTSPRAGPEGGRARAREARALGLPDRGRRSPGAARASAPRTTSAG